MYKEIKQLLIKAMMQPTRTKVQEVLQYAYAYILKHPESEQETLRYVAEHVL